LVEDPGTGELISDAEVAETTYTAFASSRHAYTGRLVVRRVKDKNSDDALFPVWRYHACFTNTTLSTVEVDLKHRQQAVIETVFADLIDGLPAHLHSGLFNANHLATDTTTTGATSYVYDADADVRRSHGEHCRARHAEPGYNGTGESSTDEPPSDPRLHPRVRVVGDASIPGAPLTASPSQTAHNE
jgi:hypothetical protein